MRSLLVILAGLYGAWHFTDLAAPSAFASVVAPLGVVVFLIALAIRLVLLFHRRGISQRAGRSDVGGSFMDLGGGDGD